MKRYYTLLVLVLLVLLVPTVYADFVEPELCTATPSISYISGGNTLLAEMNLASDCPLPGDGSVDPPERLWDYTVIIQRRTFYPLSNETLTEEIYNASFSGYEYAAYSSIFAIDITGHALEDYHSYQIFVILHGEKGADEFFWGFNSGWVNAENQVQLNPAIGDQADDFKVATRNDSNTQALVSPTTELKSK